MLLLDAVLVRHMDFCAPVFHNLQCGPNQMHGVLPAETGCDIFGEVGIGKMGHITSELFMHQRYDYDTSPNPISGFPE